jgi:hypothetical protein
VQTNYTQSNLIGSPGSPAALAAATPVAGTLDVATAVGTQILDSVTLAVELQPGGTAPSTATTVQWAYSLDGTNYVNDGTAQSVTLVASTNLDVGPYDPPRGAKKARVTVTCGATTGISLFAQATVATIG